jgi:hypothetical protein
MTTPTQQEALAMARKAGFEIDPREPEWVSQVQIHALVTAAYKLGREDAAKCETATDGGPNLRYVPEPIQPQDWFNKLRDERIAAAAIRNRN